MAFFLFILVNATLFLRPAEVFGAAEFESLYQYLIILCLAVSVPDILAYFSAAPLTARPMTFCVLGILGCVPLAYLAQGKPDEAFTATFNFFKVVVYFLLLVSLITRPARFRSFITWVLAFAMIIVALETLTHHEAIKLPGLKMREDVYSDPNTHELMKIKRLQGTGIFQDPNEKCVILAALLPLCLFTMFQAGAFMRPFWFGGVLLFGYAISLTQSRGGLLAMLCGLAAILVAKFGGRKAIIMGVLGFPVLLVLFAGRQTEISTKTGTAATRLDHWDHWLYVFRLNPLTGAGMAIEKEVPMTQGEEKKTEEWKELLAHNSFIQAFADLGAAGGMFFLGAFLLAAWATFRMGKRSVIVEPTLRQLQPFVVGSVAAYGIGLLTLSICYTVPTYLFLGLAAAFTSAAAFSYPQLPALRFNAPVVSRIALASFGYLAASLLFVRLFLNRI